MEKERLNIFNEYKQHIGVATREEVHKVGYWHEAFHCWLMSRVNGTRQIYLQLRSEMKKDYPNLFDITAAGHLLENETVFDGVREVKEEIGVDLQFDDLEPLGIIQYQINQGDFVDKEIAHVFLYQKEYFENFILQKEEVAGMVKAEFNDFADLWYGNKDSIQISGYKLDKDGWKIEFNEYVGKERFVPHPNEYYQTVIRHINKISS